MGAGDDDVYLSRTGLRRAVYLFDLLVEADLGGGEARRNGGHRDAGAFESFHGHAYQIVVDADRGYFDTQTLSAQRLQDVGAHGAASLRAEADYVTWGVV